MQNATPTNFSVESVKELENNWSGTSSAAESTASTAASNQRKGQSVSTTAAAAAHSIYMADLSATDDEDDSEVEPFPLDQDDVDQESMFETPKFLLSADGSDSPDLQSVDPETQARLEALLEAAGIGKLSTADGKHLADPEMLRKLTSSVSCALDEAAAALSRMKAESASQLGQGEIGSLADACNDGDAGAVKKLLEEGRSVNETTEEGDSLLSLACQAGYYELAQVLLAMRANVEDRGIKGDCTPLMEAASAGHVDIVKLLVSHGADVNAQSSSGNTPLMYACAGGHEEVMRGLLKAGANVEDHNENGHTPLMEAASAGHVGVAKILLEHGAGVNTHSNEFKESALTLACYKGHLEMVRFLLEAGADQEHKTDEMHTALMEASMDGHVEVARLLLDSGAQVNMPADSFESPLTLAACGGHVELAMLLLERSANIEEVNDEGYTPLMEAAREGHEEMVALLLSQGADINAQTEETQETALTLACCGGFLEVADFLIKAGADIELGASTPLMEAAQEGRLELVKYLLTAGGNAHACTQTGDTALTYACENGHTDVADLLLQAGADLEHESEGGRTPLMKAARAGHVCTVQFLISRGSDVNRQTTNNDHTPLSLACAGGHLVVVELLLAHGANPTHRLKDNSTMLIEAAKGGHTSVVQLLLDYPHNLVATSTPPDLSQLSTPTFDVAEAHRVPPHGMPHPTSAEADPGVAHAFYHNLSAGVQSVGSNKQEQKQQQQHYLCTSATTDASVQPVDTLTTAELQQVKNTPHLLSGFPPDIGFDFEGALVAGVGSSDVSLELDKDVKPCERLEACINNMMKKAEQLHHNREEQILQKQQILEELQRVERELQEKAQAQLLMNAQAQLRIEQQHGIPPSCSLSGSSSSSLLEMSQNLTSADAQFGVTFKSPNILSHQQETKLSPLATGILSSCLVEAATSLAPSAISTVPLPVTPSEKLALTTVKAIMKKEGKVSREILPPLELIEGMGKLNIGTDTFVSGTEPVYFGNTEQVFLGNTKHQGCLEHSLADGMVQATMTTCGGRNSTAISDMVVTSSQVQSQDSAVVSVGLHSFQSPSTTSSSSGLQQEEKHDAANKNLKSITQIKNHLNSVTVNTCSVMGNIPLSSVGAVPQLPCSQQVVLSQQHYVPTSTVATQYIDPSLSTSSLSLPFIQQTAATQASPQVSLQNYPLIDVNSQTDSNHDTALTLACAGGHEELVQLLLARGADIEHRDKKGFTPLILAATAGHVRVVDILLNHGADIEAQSERTKDTPLSLACSGGRHDVVESLLNRGANKEHRNVSDYTPLSLAASGGYVNIIKLLLNHGAEINSRTGSKLGISPLMLAAMNGHTQAVKLLLDMGSDINAQIETNRNTALTLACFQGRNEVVSLLVDRKANVEHRAKTGLTPLMEAASGGYVEVGRVLLDKGADVNAPPVPSSRDTALTIAADKGHYHFVELLLSRGAQVDVKNKKGNSPMWLAANGGHLDVVKLLLSTNADIDSQDNRKVSCLMAAFRKGHIKVVKWMVKHVTQFPSDQEMGRYLATFNDDELHEKCNQCLETIRAAKDCQAVEANKNASTLLEELNIEKAREENKKAAAVKRREQKRKKKKEKLDKKVVPDENDPEEQQISRIPDMELTIPLGLPTATLTTTVSVCMPLTSTNKTVKRNDPAANVPSSDGVAHSRSANDWSSSVSSLNNTNKSKLKTKTSTNQVIESLPEPETKKTNGMVEATQKSLERRTKVGRRDPKRESIIQTSKEAKIRGTSANNAKDKPQINNAVTRGRLNVATEYISTVSAPSKAVNAVTMQSLGNKATNAGSLFSSSSSTSSNSSSSSALLVNDKKRDQPSQQQQQQQQNNFSSSIISLDDYSSMTFVSNSRSAVKPNKKADVSIIRNTPGLSNSIKAVSTTSLSPKKGAKREEGWKEVVRNDTRSRSKKVIVPANAISRVIGRGGCNINTIREVSGATIEVEKQKGAGDRNINIRGSAEAMRQAHLLINMMVKDPEKDLSELIPANKKASASSKLALVGQSIGATQLLMSGLQPKITGTTTVLKSGNLPGLFSSSAFPTQPPFSAPVRQPSAVRPGMALSPAFPATSSWPAFPVPSSVSTGKKSSGSAASSSSSSSVASQSDGSSGVIPASLKTSAARQLFPPEMKALPSTGTSATAAKVAVSYTFAVSGSGRAAKAVSSNSNATFAAKVTESRSGSVSATGTAAQSTNKSAGKAPGSSSSSRGSTQSIQHPLGDGSRTRNSIIGNSMSAIGSQSSFTSNSQPVYTVSSTATVLLSSLATTRPTSPPPRLTPTPTAIPQDYSPFNNLFSNVAQQSVWGKERDDGKGMNFASVAAANVKSSSSGICSSSSLSSSLNGIPPPPPPPPPADASKAPGYRGNAHISPSSSSSINNSGAGLIPGSSSVVGPISPSSRPRLPNSAPSTPPIGPIAPPVGSVRKASPPLVGSSDPIASLSSSAPAALLPGPLPLTTGQPHHHHHHHHHPFPNAAPLNAMPSAIQQQQSLLRPSMDLNPGFIQRTSSPGQLVSAHMSGNQSYSSSTNACTTSTVPSIQSNLNPNAPDFSSRSMANSGSHPAHHLVAPHAQALHLSRLSSIQDNQGQPPFSHVNPSSVVFSIQNLTPLINTASSSMASGGPMMNPVNLNSNLKHTFQAAPQPPPVLQQQQQNSNLSSEYPQHLVRHVSASDALRLVGAVNSHQSVHGSLPPGSIGAATMAHLSQMHPSLSNSLIQSQRTVGVAHSKDDCSNMSPASSPHASNPSSPLAISAMSEHRSFGEDRKLPRPIGTERAHKKAPNYGGVVDCDIFQWRGSFGSSSEHMASTHDDRLPVMQQNYIARFGDNLGSVLENSHHMEANFQVCRPTKSMMSTIHPSGLNSGFPPFINGMPQQMPQMSQVYTTSAAVGIDIWGNGNNMKPNHGVDVGVQQQQQQQQPPDSLNAHPLAVASLVSGQTLGGGGGPGSGLGPHQQPTEHKMMWNSWNHMQM